MRNLSRKKISKKSPDEGGASSILKHRYNTKLLAASAKCKQDKCVTIFLIFNSFDENKNNFNKIISFNKLH